MELCLGGASRATATWTERETEKPRTHGVLPQEKKQQAPLNKHLDDKTTTNKPKGQCIRSRDRRGGDRNCLTSNGRAIGTCMQKLLTAGDRAIEICLESHFIDARRVIERSAIDGRAREQGR